jgi:hypothetical protein
VVLFALFLSIRYPYHLPLRPFPSHIVFLNPHTQYALSAPKHPPYPFLHSLRDKEKQSRIYDTNTVEMDMDADVAATNLQRIGESFRTLLPVHTFQSFLASTSELPMFPVLSLVRAFPPHCFYSSHVMDVTDRLFI